MSYKVLARKWRPQRFIELVGQEHIIQALMNTLDNDWLHHAYLFTGTRGVGKTTLARIFAKSLNCEKGVSSKPCCICRNCCEVDNGCFVDLLEVDAASRTKVDQTRELLDDVPYAPSRGRYKIYLIDEVHMFSESSFNALLKTLEEPPSHVKFLLATTDPKQIPITILSRCLQFHLKSLTIEQIINKLQYILKTENIVFEERALEILSIAADGSMRDALSLLDQIISFCGRNKITEEATITMLGIVNRSCIYSLIDALIAQNSTLLMHQIEKLSEQSPNFFYILDEVLRILHRLAIQIAVPKKTYKNFDQKYIKHLINNVSCLEPEEVQLYYQIGLIGKRDLPLAPDPRSGFEMIMLRMLAFYPNSNNSHIPVSLANNQSNQKIPTEEKESLKQGKETGTLKKEKIATTITPLFKWNTIIKQLKLGGLANQLASHCILKDITKDKVILILSTKHSALINDIVIMRLENALSQYLDKNIKLEIEFSKSKENTPSKNKQNQESQYLAKVRADMSNDSFVKKAQKLLGAQLLDDTIELN